jgi:muramoyltetrapeptide carboxypeptidase
MTIKKWSYLKKGDIVDIVASTPGIAVASLEADLQQLSAFVKQIGLSPRINYTEILNGADFFSKSATKTRENALCKALLAEDSKAIWFIRGGYGTSKLLPALEKIHPPKVPKLLIGYSDINCLHLWINKFWQWPSLHASVLYEFLQERELIDIELLKMIFLVTPLMLFLKIYYHLMKKLGKLKIFMER